MLLNIFGFLLSSCEREARVLTLELEIDELICSDGQRLFEGRLLELEGIKTVTANIQTHKAQIKYREIQVSVEQVKAHLLEFGFTIDGVPGNVVARNRLPSCCLEQGQD